MGYTKGLLKSYSRRLSRGELYDEAMIAYYEQGAYEEGYDLDDWCNDWIEKHSPEFLNEGKEGTVEEEKLHEVYICIKCFTALDSLTSKCPTCEKRKSMCPTCGQSTQLLDQSKEGIEMESEHGEGLVDVPESNVRIVLDLEGALLEFPAPDSTCVRDAWLTTEEGTQEGGFAASRQRVRVTSFADGSFHIDRVPGDDWMDSLT